MKPEQQRVYTAAERAETVAAARAWKGTQAEFAAARGIAQSTVSKWLGAADRREYTAAEREEAVAALRAWKGTQTAFAIARGIPQTTLSRWVDAASRLLSEYFPLPFKMHLEEGLTETINIERGPQTFWRPLLRREDGSPVFRPK